LKGIKREVMVEALAMDCDTKGFGVLTAVGQLM
jgi:hypothetical protein